MSSHSYNAPSWLHNPHVQSALGSLPIRSANGLRAIQLTGAVTRQHIIDAGDGVRLLGFHSSIPGREPCGMILLLHGWEGSSESSYMRHTCAYLLKQGFDVFRLNFRDHGNTHHLNEGLFHSCRLAEVVQAAKAVAEKFPAPRFGVAGYSLGGNFALRLALAASDAGIPLYHAVAVCPVIDPSAVMRTLESSLALYHWFFITRWRSSLRKKRALFPQHYDCDDVVLAQNMRGLTQWLVKRHTEKIDLEDYFNGYTVAGSRLASLKIPISILAAADDPVIPIETLRALNLPRHSHLEIAEYGGHCGFLEGLSLNGFSERWVALRLKAAIT